MYYLTKGLRIRVAQLCGSGSRSTKRLQSSCCVLQTVESTTESYFILTHGTIVRKLPLRSHLRIHIYDQKGSVCYNLTRGWVHVYQWGPSAWPIGIEPKPALRHPLGGPGLPKGSSLMTHPRTALLPLWVWGAAEVDSGRQCRSSNLTHG